jgi:hypothetical protein
MDRMKLFITNERDFFKLLIDWNWYITT